MWAPSLLPLYKVFLLYRSFYQTYDAPDKISEIQKAEWQETTQGMFPQLQMNTELKLLRTPFFFFTNPQGSLTIQPAQQWA